MNNKIDAIIFDLDGTLLNTLSDLGDSVNAVLAEDGCPVHPLSSYRQFVGNGAVKMIERAFRPYLLEGVELNEKVQRFIYNYSQNWDRKTRPYRGILPLLEQLVSLGVPMAVLSNKPHTETLKCVGAFFPAGIFVEVAGQREGISPKPSPDALFTFCKSHGWKEENCLYIGDSSVDMETAAAASMKSVGVSWGFRGRSELEAHGAWRVIDNPYELLDLVNL